MQEIHEFMRTANYDGLNALETVTIITATAAFIDPHTVSVDTGRDRLAIGAEPRGPRWVLYPSPGGSGGAATCG